MAASQVAVRGLSKDFGRFRALDDVSFEVGPGELVCLLGPSGCGKTTLLRCIAGLEMHSAGTIEQAGRDISALPPSQRDFGIVFQSYALFPNLSVRDNIAFGLVNAGWTRARIEPRVAELLALVGLGGQEGKFPAQLSGGQQQRVALARALAPSPGLLLLDEPLSALDAKVRAHLRREIRELQKRLGVTTLMVTHDQEEAQAMADRIVLMNAGRIEQVGTPVEVYDEPASAFAADFIGVMNFLAARETAPGVLAVGGGELRLEPAPAAGAPAAGARAAAAGAPLQCAIRPEHVRVGTREGGAPQRGGLDAVVRAVETLGAFRRVHLQLAASGEALVAELRRDHGGTEDLPAGAAVSAWLDPQRVHLYPAPAA